MSDTPHEQLKTQIDAPKTAAMKYTMKLPLTVAAVVSTVALVGLFGLHRQAASANAERTALRAQGQLQAQLSTLSTGFKEQVQEWKNVLLRGKDPEKLAKHWNAFVERERDVSRSASEIASRLPSGEARALVEQFASAHEQMGGGYRRGLDAFRSKAFEAVAGDAAVSGVDRGPAKLLAEAAKSIETSGMAASEQAAADSRRTQWTSTALMLAAALLGLGGGVLLSRSITSPLTVAVQASQNVAGGDLTTSIASTACDEIGELLRALARMQARLAETVIGVRRNAEQVATASAQIAAGNTDLSARTEQQASALQQAAASMEQLGSTVRQNADNVRVANDLALDASNVAAQGGEVVGQVVETMKGINDSSRRIAEIIGTIDGIAFQTNILALNAAVEAARAGEQGRGFAVVASEVRGLAHRSAEAAKEIKALISTSVGRVETGAALVDRAGSTMSELVASVHRVAGVMGEIRTATAEQSRGIEQIGQAVAQMDHTTQQNAALVEESAAAAESLKGQADRLVTAVAVFRTETAVV